jgi:class 3 adenylate cyclase
MSAIFFDYHDFCIYSERLLLRLSRDTPFQRNLQELMASILDKAIDNLGCTAATHIFVNQGLGEAHAMCLCKNTPAWQATVQFGFMREGRMGENPDGLPEYLQIDVATDSSFCASLGTPRDPYLIELDGEVLDIFSQIREMTPDDQRSLIPTQGERVLIVHLARKGFPRLGALVLSGYPEGEELPLEGQSGEALVGFGRAVSRLMQHAFQSFYDMQPRTYLPSYFKPMRKKVALMCAQVRHFDLIARALDIRKDQEDFNSNPEARRICLAELVNCFSQTVAEIVESYSGRVDQIWGDGLMAVFGEYLDATEEHVTACMRAVQAASEAVKQFEQAKEAWFTNHFRIGDFNRVHSELISTALGIGVSFGEVDFDYLGSQDHRRYMCFGDLVCFTQDLTELACRTKIDGEASPRFDAPIIVTRPVFEFLYRQCIFDSRDQKVGDVEKCSLIGLPGRSATYPVYTLFPGNITSSSS